MPSHTHAIESLRSFGARTRQSDSPRFHAMVGRILMREPVGLSRNPGEFENAEAPDRSEASRAGG